MTDTIRLSVRLPKKLHQAAKDADGSIAETIRVALEHHLKVYRETSQVTIATYNPANPRLQPGAEAPQRGGVHPGHQVRQSSRGTRSPRSQRRRRCHP